jgi:ribosomal protein S18 acetylase RimI-like enzyme
LTSGKIEIVPCDETYWEHVLTLRNHKIVKKGFIQQEDITWETHEQYMKEYHKYYRICLIDEKMVGYVGSIDGDIRVAVSPNHQGKGIGKTMIESIMQEYPSSEAKVKMENEASIRLFEACGFKKKYYILERENAS